MLDFSKNHFELFGLPVTFVVDNEALRERYRELQRVVHPDRYAGGSEQERRLSMQGSAKINEAYDTLRDPVRRASYMLDLHGVGVSPLHETTKDAAFLMEQLELREELAGIKDRPDPLAAVEGFLARTGEMIRRMISEMAVDLETPDAERLERVREQVRKMQFLNKLHAEAEAVEAALEDEVH